VNSREKRNKIQEGIISTTPRGVGFVALQGFSEDILIPREYLNKALNGDTVAVSLSKKREGRQEGRVLKVVKRAQETFVGSVEKNNRGYFVKPDSIKMYVDIELSGKQEVGKKVLVKITSWKDKEGAPQGEVLEVLGKKGEHEVEMKSIILGHNIDYTFSKDVEAKAKESAQRKIVPTDERKDIRNITTFTIDPKDAKDFDDAISVKKLPEGELEIGVHIADVSHYVVPGTILDEEARNRAFSVYLVDRTIPMLPEVLSNGSCSLVSNEDRYAFSIMFTFSKSGDIKDSWIGKTIINSDKRFSYEEAEEVLKRKSGHFYKELEILNSVAKRLKKERMKNGSIDFASDEVAFDLDSNGKTLQIYKKERLSTHKLVEEFMLLANKKIAERIYEMCTKRQREHLFIFRAHDIPDRAKLEELGIFLRALGYDVTLPKGDISPKEVSAILKQVEHAPEEALINTAVLRSMSKATYTTNQKGHFGLAFEHYTHFTSPIRRYIDLLVHRLLVQHLKDDKIPQKEFALYEKIAREASEKEVGIMEAERESIRYKQVEFLKEKVGKTFDATITGVSEYGLFVEEANTKASGRIHLNTLKDDYYELIRKEYAIVGKNTKNRLHLSQKVKVKLLSADLDKKQLEFELVKES